MGWVSWLSRVVTHGGRTLVTCISLFGETEEARLVRLRHAENEDPDMDYGLGGGFEVVRSLGCEVFLHVSTFLFHPPKTRIRHALCMNVTICSCITYFKGSLAGRSSGRNTRVYVWGAQGTTRGSIHAVFFVSLYAEKPSSG